MTLTAPRYPCLARSLARASLDLEVGREIAKRDHILLSGCSTGISYSAVKGAKSMNGLTLGISPHDTKRKSESITYNFLDACIYSGLGYKGRNVLTIRSADGIIIINGGFGTLNEVTIAEGENKPISIIEGTGGCADILRNLFKELNPDYNKICYTKNLSSAIDFLIEVIEDERS